MKGISRSRLLLGLGAALVAVGTFATPVATHAAPILPNNVDIDIDGFVLSGPYSTVAGQPTAPGVFANGNTGSYEEGSCVPIIAKVVNDSNVAGEIGFRVVYDYTPPGLSSTVGAERLEAMISGLADPLAADNLNDFTYLNSNFNTSNNFSASTTAGTTVNVGAIVSGPYSGALLPIPTTPFDSDRHYYVFLNNVPAHARVNVTMCARLGDDAGSYPSNIHVSASDALVGNNGGVVPINAGQLLELPTLTITKQISGGSAQASNWTFNVNPAINGTSNFTMAAGTSTFTFTNVPPGAYTITEPNSPADYTFTGASGACTYGNNDASVTLTSSQNPQTVNCTLVNTFTPPVPTTGSITVVKVVDNTAGGTLTPGDFPLFLDGNPVTNGVASSVSPGTYAVTETNATDYVASYSADCSTGSITVAAGESKTCTITNTYVDPNAPPQTGTVTYILDIISDDGGTSPASDFIIIPRVNGTAIMQFYGSATGTTVTLPVGALTFSDGVALGYKIVTTSPGCHAILGPGDNVTCTITYDDLERATVTYYVDVTSNNGGTSTASDVIILPRINGYLITSFPGSATGTTVQLPPGQLTFSDGVPWGYKIVTTSPGCHANLAPGDTAECTIYYDDYPPMMPTTSAVTMIINVTNDNGGTLSASDFIIMPRIDGALMATFPGSASGTTTQLPFGNFTFSDGVPAGYVIMGASPGCYGFLAPGETRDCIVDYTDIAAGTATFYVNVTNNNGGTSTASDFTITPIMNNDPEPSFPGSASGTTVTMRPGAMGYSAVLPPGYVLLSASPECTAYLSHGAHLDCTLTYDDDPAAMPTTSVVTYIVNVTNDDYGTATSSDVLILPRIDGTQITSFNGSASGTVVNLPFGNLSFSDGVPAGYVIVSASPECSGPLAIGESRTCTIEYTDITSGMVTYILDIQNNNGGTSTAADFIIIPRVNGTAITSFNGSASGTTVVLPVGALTFSDGVALGYQIVTTSPGCHATLAQGDNVTCTITYEDANVVNPNPNPCPRGGCPQGTVIVETVVINDQGGFRNAGDFQQSIAAGNPSVTNFNGSSTGIAILVDPGAYTVSQVDPALYSMSLSASCSGTIAAGQTITCTIVNDDQLQTGGGGNAPGGGGNGGGGGGGGTGGTNNGGTNTGGTTGGGTSGGSTGGSGSNNGGTTPEGQVLGATDEDLSGSSSDPASPSPTVGSNGSPATTGELPRTGLPLEFVLGALLPFALRKRHREE